MEETDRAAEHRVLAHTLRTSLEPLGARLVFADVSEMSPRDVAAAGRAATPQNVQVWIDLTVRGKAIVYVTEGRNVFTRRLELGGTILGPVGLDLIDVVVTDSVRSVLAGRPVGVTREEFSRALDTAEPGGGPVDAQARAGGTSPRSTEARTSGASAGSGAPAGQPEPLQASGGAASPEPPAQGGGSTPPLSPIAPAPDAAQDTSRVGPDTLRRGPLPAAPEPREADRGGHSGGLVTVDYEAALLGASRIVHGPRVCLGLDRSPFRLSLAVGARLPDAVSPANDATVHFVSLTLRASAAYLVALSMRSSLVGSLGAGFDLGRVRPTSDQSDITPARPFWTLDTIVRPALGFEHRIGALIAGVTLALDLDLRGSRYVVAPPITRPIVTPLRVRPVALASVGSTF
jgi:hypothetical protein